MHVSLTPVLMPQLSRLLLLRPRHNSKSSDVSVRVRVVGSAHSPCGQRLRCFDRSAQIAGPVLHPGPLAFPAAAAARRRCSLPRVSTAERVASNSWWHCNPSRPPKHRANWTNRPEPLSVLYYGVLVENSQAPRKSASGNLCHDQFTEADFWELRSKLVNTAAFAESFRDRPTFVF